MNSSVASVRFPLGMYLPILASILLVFFYISRWTRQNYVQQQFELVTPDKETPNPIGNAALKGYQKFCRTDGKPFYVRYWQRDYLVMPPKYLPDVRRAKRDHLVFLETASDILFMYNWIGDLFKSDRMVFAVIKGVNPQLHKLSKPMIEESQFALDKEFMIEEGEARSVKVLDAFLAICLRITTRAIAGKDLARSEAFINGTKSYFQGNLITSLILLAIPLRGALRDFVGWPFSKYHQRFRQQPLIDIIKPFTLQQIKDHKEGKRDDEELNVVQCSLDNLEQFPFAQREAMSQTLSHETLQLIWAGGQSPAMALTTVLFKLLELPQYLAPLREEAQSAVRKHGWADPIFNELPKIDSFIRETNRLYPAFALSATRLVKDKPFTFFDGLTLEPGTRIAFPVEACQQDPDITEDPLVFDGFRFLRLASTEQEDSAHRWSASHSDSGNLSFGYGNHACPGRFISIRLLKILMARLLVEYELSWDRDGAPPKISFEGTSFPDKDQEIIFRKVKIVH